LEYEITPLKKFLKELDQLSDKAKKIVNNKINLLEINPFRNKRIKGYNCFCLESDSKTIEKKNELFTK